MLARQAAVAVGVRTCWPWETAATLPSARRRKALRRPWGGEGRGISWWPPAYSLSGNGGQNDIRIVLVLVLVTSA